MSGENRGHRQDLQDCRLKIDGALCHKAIVVHHMAKGWRRQYYPSEDNASARSGRTILS